MQHSQRSVFPWACQLGMIQGWLPRYNLVNGRFSLTSLDPQQWSEADVGRWLGWAIKEFNLEGVDVRNFTMQGKEMCAMGKEMFLARTPHFMGDILWEHLERLLKGTCSLLSHLSRLPLLVSVSISVPPPWSQLVSRLFRKVESPTVPPPPLRENSVASDIVLAL